MSRKLLSLAFLSLLTAAGMSQEVISWKDAAKFYGQEKTVEGRIVLTRNTGKVCFLNFSTNYQADFTAVIFASSFAKFPANPESYYKDKTVRVTGKIEEYRGKPEIIVNRPSQIQFVGQGAKPQK